MKTSLPSVVKKAGIVLCAVFGIAVNPIASVPVVSQTDPFQLALVLKSARVYCRRLERAAMDFVCMEEISEKLDLSRDRRQSPVEVMPQDVFVPGTSSHPGGINLRSEQRTKTRRDNVFIFDYQFTRAAGALNEKRALISVNGRKGKADEAPSTSAFRFKDILLGPVQLLAEENSEYYECRLLREDAIFGMSS